jgi:glycogen(starch) synthase
MESPDGGVLQLPGNVRCIGQLGPAEMASWMARATIFALPARYEPFGLAALEAALCGCALVLGDIPTLREVWGDAALYASPDDDKALIEAITTLSTDWVQLRALSRAARARALELSPQRMAVRYSAVYDRLVDAAISPEVIACAS